MIHIFIDTDIILDFLGDRKPFSKHASLIFINAEQKEFKLYTSSNSITTAYYILCKLTDEQHARNLIAGLFEYVTVIAVTETILKQALKKFCM